eukprot:1155781-Pelagomonas_calceolata.AAC.1
MSCFGIGVSKSVICMHVGFEGIMKTRKVNELGTGAGAVDVSVACSLFSLSANQKVCDNEFPLRPAGSPVSAMLLLVYFA